MSHSLRFECCFWIFLCLLCCSAGLLALALLSPRAFQFGTEVLKMQQINFLAGSLPFCLIYKQGICSIWYVCRFSRRKLVHAVIFRCRFRRCWLSLAFLLQHMHKYFKLWLENISFASSEILRWQTDFHYETLIKLGRKKKSSETATERYTHPDAQTPKRPHITRFVSFLCEFSNRRLQISHAARKKNIYKFYIHYIWIQQNLISHFQNVILCAPSAGAHATLPLTFDGLRYKWLKRQFLFIFFLLFNEANYICM